MTRGFNGRLLGISVLAPPILSWLRHLPCRYEATLDVSVVDFVVRLDESLWY